MAGGTVTYISPVGGPLAPTALQAQNANTVVAQIAFGAAADDDDTVITHNLNLTPADGTLGIPEVDVIATALGVVMSLPKIAYTSKDSITVSKTIKAPDSSATWRFTIKRPHTLTR